MRRYHSSTYRHFLIRYEFYPGYPRQLYTVSLPSSSRCASPNPIHNNTHLRVTLIELVAQPTERKIRENFLDDRTGNTILTRQSSSERSERSVRFEPNLRSERVHCVSERETNVEAQALKYA